MRGSGIYTHTHTCAYADAEAPAPDPGRASRLPPTPARQTPPAAEHPARFFTYWSLKEAYIKARGLGLAIPLGAFTFRLDGGGHSEIAVAATDSGRLPGAAALAPNGLLIVKENRPLALGKGDEELARDCAANWMTSVAFLDEVDFGSLYQFYPDASSEREQNISDFTL